MSAREWKPGDVAMVECSDGEWRQAHMQPSVFGEHSGSWVFADNARRLIDDSIARPLVVIDPEDREQVERLHDILMESEASVPATQDALREFANPSPPRCRSALIVKGEQFPCDQLEGHGLSHANVAAGAIWGESA